MELQQLALHIAAVQEQWILAGLLVGSGSYSSNFFLLADSMASTQEKAIESILQEKKGKTSRVYGLRDSRTWRFSLWISEI